MLNGVENEYEKLIAKLAIDENDNEIIDNALKDTEAEKERIMVAIAEDKGRQLKKEEMIRFLQEQTAELDEFDDALVRKLVEQVVVHGDGTFTVEFKSGAKV